MSTAQDLPVHFGLPADDPSELAAPPALRLVTTEPLDFDAAVKAVRPRLHRYATRRLGDTHEAEELVQEALLRAYSHREKFDTEEDLSAWSTVVTGRLVIDRLRVRHRCTSVADVPETGRRGRDTADVVVARDEARTALDALDAMPARQASVLWAREVEGDSYEQLCVRFGMSEPAVRSILTRARKSLRAEYALRGGTLPVGGLAVLAPWLTGLTWAQRLRRAASRITAPASLATVGITALGGLVLAPFGGTPHDGAPFVPHRAIVSQHAVVAPQLTTITGTTVATVRAHHATSTAVTTPVTAPRAQHKVIDDTDLPCHHNSPVQSASCAPADKGAHLWLEVPLPANPVTHQDVGVSQSDYDCTGWQANPVIACTPGGASR